jgi:hypothetical protein
MQQRGKGNARNCGENRRLRNQVAFLQQRQEKNRRDQEVDKSAWHVEYIAPNMGHCGV